MSANVLKTLATTVISTSNMLTTAVTKIDKILDNSLGSIEDLSSNMRDYTRMQRLSDMTTRRRAYLLENPEINQLPQALQDLLNMKIE